MLLGLPLVILVLVLDGNPIQVPIGLSGIVFFLLLYFVYAKNFEFKIKNE